ncbi:MAG: hypothetical protein IJR66_05040 [Clostridia bacterium]|nr:hypothetical protein [Clostridia bacterium]MBQ6979797.1 hypothetical protein [Clostridia bacterium]MBQ9514322.1 hypothetical protein [Clostridia bacterium]
MNKKQALLQILTTRKRGLINHRLPDEYQQIEYIENTDGCYIQTNIVPSVDTNCEIDFEVSVNDDNCNVIMGSSNTYSGAPAYIIGLDPYTGASKIFWIRVGDSIAINIFQSTAITHLRHKIRYENKKLFINEEEQTLWNQPNLTESLAENPIAIFIRRQYRGYYPTSGHTKLGKLYYCRFWGDVEAELIPCYRKSDDKTGLYDKVSGTFYTNNGSGNFVRGSII